MSEETVRRMPGKRVFGASKPTLSLVPPPEDRAAPSASKPELSQSVKQMLRKMSRRRETDEGSDAPDAA